MSVKEWSGGKGTLAAPCEECKQTVESLATGPPAGNQNKQTWLEDRISTRQNQHIDLFKPPRAVTGVNCLHGSFGLLSVSFVD